MERVKIKDYNYEVDKKGNIYNISTGHNLKTRFNRDGYRVVTLWKNNKSICKTVHRLVALAFLPNPHGKPCVNHMDGDKSNSDVNNLEWCTYSENSIHSFKNNLQVCKKGEDVHNALFTNEQVHEICKLMQDGLRNIDIERRLGIPRMLVKNIRAKGGWVSISSQYNIPSKSRVLSEETVLWIVRMIQEGFRNKEIVDLSNNPRVNKSIVSKIKNRTTLTDITQFYDF